MNKLLETSRVGQKPKPSKWVSFASNPKSQKGLGAVPKIIAKKVKISPPQRNILEISKDPKKFEVKKSKEMMISKLRQVFCDLHYILDESSETNYQAIFENITNLADLCRSGYEQRELRLYIEEVFSNTGGGIAQLSELVKLLNDNFVDFRDDNESKEPYPRELIYDLGTICEILPKYNMFFEPIQRNFIELKQKYFNHYFSTVAKNLIRGENLEHVKNDIDICKNLEPENIEPYKLMAAFYSGQEDYGSAIDEYCEALELQPNNSNLLTMRANCFLKLNEYEYADRDFKAAIKANPSNIDAYLSRAESYADQFKIVKAIDDYSMAIKLEPEMAVHYYCRAILKRAIVDASNIDDFIEAITKDKGYAQEYIRNYIKDFGAFAADEVCAAIKEQYGEKRALGFFNMSQINK